MYVIHLSQTHSQLKMSFQTSRDGSFYEKKKPKNGYIDLGEDARKTDPKGFAVADGISSFSFSTRFFSEFLVDAFVTTIKEFKDHETIQSKNDKILATLQKVSTTYNTNISKFVQDWSHKFKIPIIFDNIGFDAGSTFIGAYIDKSQNTNSLMITQIGDAQLVIFRPYSINSNNLVFYRPVYFTKEMQYHFNTPFHIKSKTPLSPNNMFIDKYEIQENDLVIGASDGLFDNMNLNLLTILINFLNKKYSGNIEDFRKNLSTDATAIVKAYLRHIKDDERFNVQKISEKINLPVRSNNNNREMLQPRKCPFKTGFSDEPVNFIEQNVNVLSGLYSYFCNAICMRSSKKQRKEELSSLSPNVQPILKMKNYDRQEIANKILDQQKLSGKINFSQTFGQNEEKMGLNKKTEQKQPLNFQNPFFDEQIQEIEKKENIEKFDDIFENELKMEENLSEKMKNEIINKKIFQNPFFDEKLEMFKKLDKNGQIVNVYDNLAKNQVKSKNQFDEKNDSINDNSKDKKIEQKIIDISKIQNYSNQELEDSDKDLFSKTQKSQPISEKSNIENENENNLHQKNSNEQIFAKQKVDISENTKLLQKNDIITNYGSIENSQNQNQKLIQTSAQKNENSFDLQKVKNMDISKLSKNDMNSSFQTKNSESNKSISDQNKILEAVDLIDFMISDCTKREFINDPDQFGKNDYLIPLCLERNLHEFLSVDRNKVDVGALFVETELFSSFLLKITQSLADADNYISPFCFRGRKSGFNKPPRGKADDITIVPVLIVEDKLSASQKEKIFQNSKLENTNWTNLLNKDVQSYLDVKYGSDNSFELI